MVQARLKEWESPVAKYPEPQGDAAGRGLLLQPPISSRGGRRRGMFEKRKGKGKEKNTRRKKKGDRWKV